MPIISPNVMRTAGEVLASHNIKPHPGERLADVLARGLGVSDTVVERWIEALDQGCTPQEANLRAGIAQEHMDEPLMVAIARAIGMAMGKAEKTMTANRQHGPSKIKVTNSSREPSRPAAPPKLATAVVAKSPR